MENATAKLLKRVLENYDLIGGYKDHVVCDSGHINHTYRVTVTGGKNPEEEYILQKINSYVFKEPVKVMHNIHEITLHLQHKKTQSDCDVIAFINAKDGKNYTCLDGDFWRVCPAVKNSVTFDIVENSKVLPGAGYAFGRFLALLSDFPMDRLYETIPDFHNTRKRLDDFFAVVALDPVGRAADVQKETAFIEKHRELACRIWDMLERGELPLRVTHNDTKYNNILMDQDTCDPLCVIDLDTVMPGLSMYDFGDAIRTAGNKAVEDEPDLTRAGLNISHYEEFTKGFMKASKGAFTKNEIDNMALGAVAITIEQAARFLADHINGDIYYRIHRENHNLDRARCQIKLAQDMLDHYDEMCSIVKKYA